ncbi:MAG: type sorting protein [Ferruginibacter sp.]|nr:type sorting protein [Ferruginibacter sp.]
MRKLYLSPLLLLLFFIGRPAVLHAQPAIGYQSVVTGLDNPVDVVNAGDSRLFIAQQNGLIRAWDGTSLSTLINIGSVLTSPAGGEQGLLSVAFHPQYLTNGYFFVWYTNTTGAVTLARYQRTSTNPDVANPSTAQVLLTIPKPGSPYFTNHNGGKLNFGSDGMLYVGTGDGGSGGDPFNNAQDPTSLRGKMLRLDVNGFATSAPFYAIPADNPFASASDGIADEIFSTGLRNPWRWSFDRGTGNIWIADVGQDNWEEVNSLTQAQASGVNYGWRCREGFHVYNAAGCAATYQSPIFEYPHSGPENGFSITGGYVYRGPDYPALTGYYVTADYVTGRIWLVRPDGTSVTQTGPQSSISGFGESTTGVLYAIKRSAAPNGTLYKVTATVVPISLVSFSGRQLTGYNQLTVVTASDQNIKKYILEYSPDNTTFRSFAETNAAGNPAGNSYSFRHNSPPAGTAYYRVRSVDISGDEKVSEVLRLTTAKGSFHVYPTMVSNQQVTLELPMAVQKIQLQQMDGRIVMEKKLNDVTGNMLLQLPALAKGIYVLRINASGTWQQERILIQ